MAGNWSLDGSPAYLFYDIFSRLFSPYTVNPANVNPLRDILEASVDFKRLKDCPINLFINATNVRTGLPRVFRNAELSADVILASACLPLMHQAIEIDGDPYWDGGFSGNPLLTPLIHESRARDVVLVRINPIERPGTPRTAREFLNRMNEISFNSSLKKELRGIAMFRRLLATATLTGDAPWIDQWSDIRLHRIATPKIAEHGADLGKRSTFDIDSLLDTRLEQV
jgi:NTE family protein